MADPRSVQLFKEDILRPIAAYRIHLIPKKRSILRMAIPLVSRGLGTFFGGPVGGRVAGGISSALVSTSRFPRYVSPFALAVRQARAQAEAKAAAARRQLDLFLPIELRTGRGRQLVARTAGRVPAGFK